MKAVVTTHHCHDRRSYRFIDVPNSWDGKNREGLPQTLAANEVVSRLDAWMDRTGLDIFIQEAGGQAFFCRVIQPSKPAPGHFSLQLCLGDYHSHWENEVDLSQLAKDTTYFMDETIMSECLYFWHASDDELYANMSSQGIV